MKPIFYKIKGIFINLQHVTILSVKVSDEGTSNLVIDFNYGVKPDPVFLIFPYPDKGEAEAELLNILQSLPH